jgi:hypothetical protein
MEKKTTKRDWNMIPNGTILVWNHNVTLEGDDGAQLFAAQPGAKVRVTKDYTNSFFMQVEFIDELGHGQKPGGYSPEYFVTIDEWREMKLKEIGI